MLRAPTFGPSRAALRSASFIRRCQPGPRRRKCAMTSGSSRSEMSSLVGAFCRPRYRRYAATISGATSMAGRMRLAISSVISKASGSAAMPALISTSSSSVCVASWRSALRRASRHILSNSFDISFYVALLSFPDADDHDPVPTAREDENMKPHADEPDGDFPQLAIVRTLIDKDDRIVPIEFAGRSKINPVIVNVGGALRFVPIIEGLRRHKSKYSRRTCLRQSNRSYMNLSRGAA